MKNETFAFPTRNPISIHLMNRRFITVCSMFILFALLNLTVGCGYYYKVTPYYNELRPEIEALKYQARFFIVHFGEDAWWLNNMTIGEDKTQLKGSLEKLPDFLLTYLDTNPDRVNLYGGKPQRGVLQEVHIYATEYAEAEASGVLIPFSSIQKIEVYDPARGATVASWVFGVTGLMAAVIILILSSITLSF